MRYSDIQARLEPLGTFSRSKDQAQSMRTLREAIVGTLNVDRASTAPYFIRKRKVNDLPHSCWILYPYICSEEDVVKIVPSRNIDELVYELMSDKPATSLIGQREPLFEPFTFPHGKPPGTSEGFALFCMPSSPRNVIVIETAWVT